MGKVYIGKALAAAGFSFSGSWDTQIDTELFQATVAAMVADEMGTNLSIGQRPGGKGNMPKGKTTQGRPRGQGTSIASSMKARKRDDGKWVIAAEERVPGQLSRVLRGVKLRTPDLERIFRVAIQSMLNPGSLESELL